MIDAAYRIALRGVAAAAAAVAFVVRPRVRGAAVLVRHDGRLLLLTPSYRRWRALPGGRLRRGEDPLLGALRELREEVGLVPSEADELRSLGHRVCHHSYIEDHVWFFEWSPAQAPVPVPDRREILDAQWVREDELHLLELWPPLEALLAAHEES